MRFNARDIEKLPASHIFRKAWEKDVANRTAISAADNKSNTGNELSEKVQAQKTNEIAHIRGAVKLRFYNYRKGIDRLDRVSGLWEKHVTDAIVTAGIISGDGPSVIPEAATHEYEESDYERTILTIEEI